MRGFASVCGQLSLAGLMLLGGDASAAEGVSPSATIRPAAGINPLRIGGKPRGKTTGRWVEWRAGAKWEGEYLDGKRHGTWEGTVPVEDDTLFADPDYAQFQGPFSLSIELHLNVPHGEMSAFDAQQRPVFTWHFDQGVLEGKAIWWHANGELRREVTYRAGLLDGPVAEWNADGKLVRQVTFREGRASGSHIDWYSPGRKRYEGYSELAGEVTRESFDWTTLRWSQAVVHEFDSEQRCGRWTAWYPNGQKKVQGGYQDGEAEGHFTWWYENGQKMAEGEYQAGQKHGAWRWWHSNGHKQLEGRYQAGQIAGDWEAWTADGRPAAVDRSKATLALEWDQKASESLGAKRSAAHARPTRDDSDDTAPSKAASRTPATKSIVKSSQKPAGGKTTASSLTGDNRSASPAAKGSPTTRGRISPTYGKIPPANQDSQPNNSDEFSLFGVFLPGGTNGGRPTIFKSDAEPTPAWGATADRRSSEHLYDSSTEPSRGILAELLGVQPVPPSRKAPRKPIRR